MFNPSCYAAMFAYALHLFAYRIDVGQVLFFTPRNAIYTGQDTLISENINKKDAIKRPLWRLTLLLNEQNNMKSALFSLKIIIIYVAIPLRNVAFITSPHMILLAISPPYLIRPHTQCAVNLCPPPR